MRKFLIAAMALAFAPVAAQAEQGGVERGRERAGLPGPCSRSAPGSARDASCKTQAEWDEQEAARRDGFIGTRRTGM